MSGFSGSAASSRPWVNDRPRAERSPFRNPMILRNTERTLRPASVSGGSVFFTTHLRNPSAIRSSVSRVQPLDPSGLKNCAISARSYSFRTPRAS